MKWISVKKELPPLNEWVLLLDPDKWQNHPPAKVGRRYQLHEEEIRIIPKEDDFDPNESFYTCCFAPTHWAPLPQMPEDGE